jgi:hypothetical protein
LQHAPRPIRKGFPAFRQIEHLPDIFKLTDTKYDQSKAIESKSLDECHIHVAYRA